MKKKLTIFLLCLCLFSCTTFNFDSNIKVVKASALSMSLSFFLLGLTSSGVSYYQNNGVNDLESDLNSFATSKGISFNELLSPFASVVVDVAKDAVKFTAMQVQVIKEYVNYLKNQNKVSDTPITATSFELIPLYGYPCIFKPIKDVPIRFSDRDGHYYTFTLLSDVEAYFCFSEQYSYNGPFTNICLLPVTRVSATYNITYSDGSNGNFNLSNINSSLGFDERNAPYPLSGSQMGSSDFGYIYLDGKEFCCAFYNSSNSNNPYTQVYTLSKLFDTCKLRFGYNTSTEVYTGLKLPSYAVDNSVFNTIDDNKPLVTYVPNIMDLAVRNALENDPTATAIGLNDLAIAIGDTAIGTIDGEASDDEDKVIAPSIDLDLTQDDAISDSITEDLLIEDEPVPPPDPPPIVDVIDISTKFPFSIFGDFALILNMFDRDPEAPVFTLGFDALGSTYEIEIDLSDYDNVARILRLMELIAFISSLIFLTIKYIRGD